MTRWAHPNAKWNDPYARNEPIYSIKVFVKCVLLVKPRKSLVLKNGMEKVAHYFNAVNASCHTRYLNFIVSTPDIRNILQIFERQFYMRSSAVENCKPWYLFFQALTSAFNTHHVSGLSANMTLSPPMCIYLALHHTFTSASLCFLNGSKSILKDFMQKLSDLNQ
jgi:hypothetical protein